MPTFHPIPPDHSPLVSCLCVTENRAPFMPWLLWNYARQQWDARELVIVDSSPAPFDPGNDDDIRVIHAPGANVPAKRNQAIAAARGVIIVWFDDDDWQHPCKISWLVEALRAGAPYAGARHSWFVDLIQRTCRAYSSPQHQIIFNSAGFRRDAIHDVRFDERIRRASDTRWMQELARRYANAARELADATPFFWLCHLANLSNPATKWRPSETLVALRQCIGADAWQDTDMHLDALCARLLASEAAAPSPTPTRPRHATTPAAEPIARDAADLADPPPVSLFIKATILDAPYLDTMVRHMIQQANYTFAQRAIVVERRAAFAGKYHNRPRATDADLDHILHMLLDDQIIDRVIEVDAAPERVRATMHRYFGAEGARVPTHAATGGPIYATLFGLDAMPTDYVVQMDADVFFHAPGKSWVAQSLRAMRHDPRLWLMMAHPGPPASGSNTLGARNARLAVWDAHSLLWRFRAATTRYFLCNRRNFVGKLVRVPMAGSCAPLEQCISHALQRHGAFRGNLAAHHGWHLHAWSHADPFPAWAELLADAIAAGKYPGLQRGEYDLRLDQPHVRAAWQSLLGQPPAAIPTAMPSPTVAQSPAPVQHRHPTPSPCAVIIPIRDRAGERLRHTLASLRWQAPDTLAQILIVSHGSQPQINAELATLCTEIDATLLTIGDPAAPWNKPHALNVGIRAVPDHVPTIMTMDADMILAPNFLEVLTQRFQPQPATLALCRSLDLPQSINLPGDAATLRARFDALCRRATPRARSGTGGIQAAPRDFFYAIRGYDEELLWWGAMDGDVVNRARLQGLTVTWIDDATRMLHQWHPRKHGALTHAADAAQAQRYWQRNHELVRARANQAARNPQGWGSAG